MKKIRIKSASNNIAARHKLRVFYQNYSMIITIILLSALSVLIACSSFTFAKENKNKKVSDNSNSERYYLGTLTNAGHNNGYSEKNEIDEDDPHYGWKLGRFFVDGYTQVSDEKNGQIAFLKNVGDTVRLSFVLEQDIDKLNGSEQLTIASDDNGYDEYFGTKKTDFGRGTLIVKKTNYQNLSEKPTIYTNYLKAKTKKNVETEIDLFEEGDYEVALDYEIKDDPRKVFNISVFPSYHDYRIYFKFSVRNGNCMIYPFDVKTGSELTDSSITENGFRLDLAKSRYLDINIKKEVLKEGADGLSEDTRFNQPARDGEQFTDEGIYTITVKNKYTNQITEKKIYVGTNDILKAYINNNLSISEIKEEIANGAQVTENGTLSYVSAKAPSTKAPKKKDSNTTVPSKQIYIIVFSIIIVLLIFIVIIIVKHIKRKNKSTQGQDEEMEK